MPGQRATSVTALPLVRALGRHRFPVMSALAVVMVAGASLELAPSNDWQFFTWGSGVLFGSDASVQIGSFTATADGQGGLHLYAEHPYLQIGPPALLLAALLQLGPGDGIYIAAAVVQAMSVLSVWCIERAWGDRLRHRRLVVLLGGSLTVVVWGSVTSYRHLDDALTLLCLAAAGLALTRQRWVTAGLLLGLGAAAKPWGVVLLVLVLVAPGARDRVRAAGAALAVLAVSWGPFVLADPATLQIGTYHLAAAPGSPLRALGLAGVLDESALRPAQFALGALLAGWLVRRGQWPAAALAAFSVRLLLDPNTYPYYSAGIVLAALMVDVAHSRSGLPVLAALATTSWLVTLNAQDSAELGWLRVTTYVVLVAAAATLPGSAGSPLPTRRPRRDRVTAAAPS